MTNLKGKIDFAVLISATNANPNGDPLNGNRPRESFDGYGEISDVCIKRKIRNRFQDLGARVFVQSDDRADDGFTSLKARAEGCAELKAILSKNKNPDRDQFSQAACREWIDVRAFGQVFAFKGVNVSVGVRGPVSVQQAVSVSPVDIISMQITKSVSGESGEKKGSDTMGTKHMVEYGIYVIKGSINVQLAQKTGFTEEDADKIKECIRTLFINDSSSARPDGSMEVIKVYWWKHNNQIGQYSSAKVHRSLQVTIKEGVAFPRCIDDYTITLEALDGLEPEIIDGI